MQVAVFHPGTQHSWQTALALQQLDRLAWFATSIFYKPDKLPYRLERIMPGPIARRMSREFRRFSHPALDPSLVRTSGAIEWIERIATRANFPNLARRLDAIGNRRFVSEIAADLRSAEPFALWGYNGGSLTSFELAKSMGRRCILDRTNGDFRVYNRMMAEIRDQYGDWFMPEEREISAASIAMDDREFALADTILVGSPFAAETIRASTPNPSVAAKLRVLNYCFDEGLFAGIAPPRPVDRSRPVKFLFMGLVIPRKGIHHILEALSRIPASAAELTIVGDMNIPRRAFEPYAERVTHLPTVARADVPAIMAEHDVLMLPSYFEGAGIVLYEALAAGCALIQSKRCALAVTDQTGVMLDRVDSNAVHDAMMVAVDDRDRLDSWRAHAQIEAGNYTFAHYRENIALLLNDLGI